MAYIPANEEEARFLAAYDPSQYQRPSVTADTVVFALSGEALKVLLIRRGNYPFKGCWAIPGGFVNINEDLLHAAQRELYEETGLENVYLEQYFTWGCPGRDPRTRVITVSYVGIADISALCAKAGDDAAEAEWFEFANYTTCEENGIITVSYTLSGKETLCPVAAYPKGRMQQIAAVDNAGIAVDHAESIAYAYAYLKQRIQNGFLDIAFDDEALKKRAMRILTSL